ncbi:cytochrome o ubiquinol oxidase subunit IV [Sphingomonas desiccabilis]|uniref:Cytochrome bo(3) ubiquinol oxidase subunit 4 n=1 Tax=Sphingomonas desiccabilis TaxID=429134 RepID=A0A4Q2IP05_9SPHN|nr:cytochrome o ubiquinol oxidase subunit IV [Sphingomonas desiccabilis]MBB3912546.1 cytochrome o ubiquinol oxidase operon protein cyoD [Sphingomonas desiccabilis]RXZ29850.1 cytochrome o ubiquinol oxidase subunit IV [Sphingomonas desiccabilis]
MNDHDHGDTIPGGESPDTEGPQGATGYTVGLFLAVLLTAMSFWIASTDVIWDPAVPVAIVVLAVAQMGVHLVFFLHVTSGPDNANNIIALAFGVLIVLLVVAGSVWVMTHLNHNMHMAPADMAQHMR